MNNVTDPMASVSEQGDYTSLRRTDTVLEQLARMNDLEGLEQVWSKLDLTNLDTDTLCAIAAIGIVTRQRTNTVMMLHGRLGCKLGQGTLLAAVQTNNDKLVTYCLEAGVEPREGVIRAAVRGGLRQLKRVVDMENVSWDEDHWQSPPWVILSESIISNKVGIFKQALEYCSPSLEKVWNLYHLAVNRERTSHLRLLEPYFPGTSHPAHRMARSYVGTAAAAGSTSLLTYFVDECGYNLHDYAEVLVVQAAKQGRIDLLEECYAKGWTTSVSEEDKGDIMTQIEAEDARKWLLAHGYPDREFKTPPSRMPSLLQPEAGGLQFVLKHLEARTGEILTTFEVEEIKLRDIQVSS